MSLRIPQVCTEDPVWNKDLTWISYQAVKSESKMAVEFSRRPLLSLLLSLWLSIFNLNSSCNWLEGQQGGTLLVGCAMPHGSQCVQAPLFFSKSIFCCNAEISPALDGLYSFILAWCPLIWWCKPEGISKRPLGRLYPPLWCITLLFCYPTSAILFLGYICLLQEAQMVSSNICILPTADVYNYHCNLYITCLLMYRGWTQQSGEKADYWSYRGSLWSKKWS